MTFYYLQTWLSPKAFIGYGSRYKPWLVIKVSANGEVPIHDCRLKRNALEFASVRNRMERKKLRAANFKRKRAGLPPIAAECRYVVKRWNVKGTV